MRATPARAVVTASSLIARCSLPWLPEGSTERCGQTGVVWIANSKSVGLPIDRRARVSSSAQLGLLSLKCRGPGGRSHAPRRAPEALVTHVRRNLPSQPRPAFAPAPPAPLRRRGRRRRRTAARSASGSLSGALRRLLHAGSLPAPLAAGRRPLGPAAPYWSG